MITNSKLKECLQKIYDKHGEITPKIVVAEARNPDSPLHRNAGFEWDVKKAAQRDCENVARGLLRRVPHYIKSDYKKQMRTPTFVRSPMAKPNEQGYVPLSSIERRSANAQIVLAAELRRVVGGLKRAVGVSAEIGFTEFTSEIESALANISGLEARLLERLKEAA